MRGGGVVRKAENLMVTQTRISKVEKVVRDSALAFIEREYGGVTPDELEALSALRAVCARTNMNIAEILRRATRKLASISQESQP